MPKSGSSFNPEQAMAYHQMLNREGTKGSIEVTIGGEKQAIEVGVQKTPIKAGSHNYEGIIYFFQNADQAQKAKTFIEANNLDPRIHIAVVKAEGLLWLR